jgi:hypothetical protein
MGRSYILRTNDLPAGVYQTYKKVVEESLRLLQLTCGVGCKLVLQDAFLGVHV